MWWLLAALLGTVAQFAGSLLTGRGAPPDSPWPDVRASQFGQTEEEVRWIWDYATRETYRIWGTSLTNTGVLLFLLSAILATTTVPFSVSRLLTNLLVGSVVLSIGTAFLKAHTTKRWRADFTDVFLGKHLKRKFSPTLPAPIRERRSP